MTSLGEQPLSFDDPEPGFASTAYPSESVSMPISRSGSDTPEDSSEECFSSGTHKKHDVRSGSPLFSRLHSDSLRSTLSESVSGNRLIYCCTFNGKEGGN